MLDQKAPINSPIILCSLREQTSALFRNVHKDKQEEQWH
jgi:hypothetical protein